MDSRRQNKIAQLLQEEVSQMLLTDLRVYLQGKFATLTYVNVNPDLSLARFNISILSGADKEEVIQNLNLNKSEIRRMLGNRMRNNLRKIPDIIFHLDDRLDYVERMDEVFKQIKEDDNRIE